MREKQTMKAKPAKQTVKTKPAAKLNDLTPRKNPRGKRGTSGTYSGSHALYQDIFIPG